MRAAVVVEPEKPENTGFIARLCENFNFDLRLVNPDFNLEDARKTASRAQETLRDARIFDTVEEAVEDLDYIVGTKPGRGQAVSDFPGRENTSIMIGRESSGLSNDELELCDAVVHIKTSDYESISQSHATAILMHQMFPSEEKGINEAQKRKLEELTDSSQLFEAVLQANVSEDEAGRIIRDLRELRESRS